jgi:hypothetical protein
VSSYRLRRAWQVRVDETFARHVADASAARTTCLRSVIAQLRAGDIDLVVSGLLPGLYFVFACDVTISAVVSGDTVVLTTITEEEED